jgi:prevent-host-death family protein
MQLGLREANQQFSKAIKAVKAGQEVILTERGKPIAVIKPLPEPHDVAAMLDRLAAAGLLRPPTKRGRMPRRKPRRLRGEPLSKTISDMRDER